jgi:ankyrin repeat protein
VAVQKGYLEIVKQLALKSNANLLNSDGKTAMKIAIDNNHLDIIKALWKDTDNRRPI